VRKDGSKFWCSVVITALHDGEDNIFGFSKVTRDLTDVKKNEDQLKLSRDQLNLKNKELAMMNEELSSFAYIASHDLQEPLRKIQTFGSKLRDLEFKQLSERGKEYIERMESAAARMQALIQDLLTYSSTNTVDAKIELVDLNKVLEEVKKELEEVINEKGVIFHSEQLPDVNGIPFQLQQLVQNIIHNAIKFSRKGVPPEISIQVKQVAAPHVLAADPSKMFHQISFTDNGIGFEQEYSSKIMEVFQRLHGKAEYSGTGIGLAICKRIAENHGGTIVAEGKVNEGASFHVYLPVKTL
ncbi:MAG TPA: ATP-binding protein, partial [Ohtaekwangia sp.]|nr:ATP-binding protein [Ohtaekwangia sp.]